jgi:hypothetical protein
LKIEKYTIGIGDRFACQGIAQLRALAQAHAAGIAVYPVWNKSNREHLMINSKPDDVRAEADHAVAKLGWNRPYYVDADHINLKNVDAFVRASDYYTIDVADFIGRAADADAIKAFVDNGRRYTGLFSIPSIERRLELSNTDLEVVARKFLAAMQEAARIYRYIEAKKGRDGFVAEISIDETDSAQSPVELFLILAMIGLEGIPVQMIAPKFTGRFNKGIDYAGDLTQFETEFAEDLSVIAFAVSEFHLPKTLKLSVHSGSDKFSLYPIINRLIKARGAGLHLKTAGTTWLEEVCGLAESGGKGLEIAKQVYAQAFERFDELTEPYKTVIDIDKNKLPDPKTVMGWAANDYISALRHVESCPEFNPHLRQLLHIGFKLAAKMGQRFTDALKANEEIIGRRVTENLFQRHLLPVFG